MQLKSNIESTSSEDDIDFKEIFRVLYYSKYLILFFIFLFICIGSFYLRNADQKYTVEITYKSMGEDRSSDLGSLGRVGGLLASSGLSNNGKGNSNFDVFEYILSSNDVAKQLFEDKDLVKKLFKDEYNIESNDYYEPQSTQMGAFKKKIKSLLTGQPVEIYKKPNPNRVSIILDQELRKNVNKNTGFLILSATHKDPNLMIDLIQKTVSAADEIVKNLNIATSSQALAFYQNKLARAKVREHRLELAKLIVLEEKKLLFASKGQNFVVEPIAKPQLSYKPTSPNPPLILMLSCIIGFIIGIIISIFRFNSKKNRLEHFA